MQVLNDKEREPGKTNERDVLAIASHAVFAAVGVASVVFGPLPMILAQLKLQPPWPRVVALAGAVLALTFLGSSLFPVLMIFVFGLYVADNINSIRSFWHLLFRSFVLAAVLGGGTILTLAQLNKMGVLSFWASLVDTLLVYARGVVRLESEEQWKAVRTLLFNEGPFMYLSLAILSVWLSVGTAAHLSWFGEKHNLAASSLRRLRLPWWFTATFALLMGVEFSGLVRYSSIVSGLDRILGSIVFVQGCVYLSIVLSTKNLRPRMRTFVYALSISVGFYALVAMGVFGSWLFRRDLSLAHPRVEQSVEG